MPALVQRVVRSRLAALVGLVGVVHLDDVGAEDGELVGGERAGQHVGAVEDLDAFERTHEWPPFGVWVEGSRSERAFS